KGHRPITYGGRDKNSGDWREWDIKWLFGQDYPLFVGVVDRHAQRTRLYSTARMWWVIWMRGDPFEVILEPGRELEGRPMNERYRRKRVSKQGDRHRWSVPLGQPIIDATQSQLEDEAFQRQVQAVMNVWIELDRNNIINWKLRVPFHAEYLEWEPNSVPGGPPKDFSYANPKFDHNVPAILLALRPGLRGLAFNLLL